MASQRVLVTGVIVWMTMTSLPLTEGHGRLLEPPSRSSMWRFGFPTKINYDDNALNCGGLNTQWYVNQGKCGVCGDAWDKPQPRDNEAGGVFGKGIITKTYTVGQVIPIQVQITANHKGWFEFRLCVHNSPSTPITHECLDKHLLELADGSGTRYPIDPNAQMVDLKVKLPDGVSCSQCVLQWKWHGGNNYGNIQEEFYGCSDIAIGTSPATSSSSTARPTNPPTVLPTHHLTTHPTPQPTVHPTAVQTTHGVSPASTPGGQTGDCHAVGQLHGSSDLDRYCKEQCPMGNCPPAYCVCASQPAVTTAPPVTVTPYRATTTTPRITTTPRPVISTASPTATTIPVRTTQPTTRSPSSGNMVCKAIGMWQGIPELDLFCNEKCPVGNCPAHYCSCTSALPVSASTLRPNTPPPTITTTTQTPSPSSPAPTTTTTTTQTPSPSSSPAPTTTTTTTYQPVTTKTTTSGCVAIGNWQGDASKDQWCNANCPTGSCPVFNCRCGPAVTTPAPPHTTPAPALTTSLPTGTNPCRAVGPWAGDPLLDSWCKHTCSQFAGCDPQYCRCDAAGAGTSSAPSSSATTTRNPSRVTPSPSQVSPGKCHGINSWAGQPELDHFCEIQCHSGGPCPPNYCSCGLAIAAAAAATTTAIPTTTSTTAIPTTTTATTSTSSSSSVTCYAINGWAGNPNLDLYCDKECKVGLCPPQYCACGGTTKPPSTTHPTTTTPLAGGSGGKQTSQCHAIGNGQGVPEMEAWCRTECARGNCPPVYCACI